MLDKLIRKNIAEFSVSVCCIKIFSGMAEPPRVCVYMCVKVYINTFINISFQCELNENLSVNCVSRRVKSILCQRLCSCWLKMENVCWVCACVRVFLSAVMKIDESILAAVFSVYILNIETISSVAFSRTASLSNCVGVWVSHFAKFIDVIDVEINYSFVSVCVCVFMFMHIHNIRLSIIYFC